MKNPSHVTGSNAATDNNKDVSVGILPTVFHFLTTTPLYYYYYYYILLNCVGCPSPPVPIKIGYAKYSVLSQGISKYNAKTMIMLAEVIKEGVS